MRHSVPHDSLIQQRQAHEECWGGLTSLNAWPTTGLSPALKMPRGPGERLLKYLEQRKYAFASMLYFYAGKGNLFWKIKSVRVEHTHTHAHKSSFLSDVWEHSTQHSNLTTSLPDYKQAANPSSSCLTSLLFFSLALLCFKGDAQISTSFLCANRYKHAQAKEICF